MRIIAYQLIDFQSWDESVGVIELELDKMNTIIAPSETGKSVIIKVLKEMCFSGVWGYTPRSLIRRNAPCGQAVFYLENNTIVVYKLFLNKIAYYIINGNDKPIVWEYGTTTGVEIPDAVANLMGLIIDRQAKTVINILDKDMMTPFINAPEELNNRILAVVTEVPEIEKRREVLKEWQQQLEETEKTIRNKLRNVSDEYNRAPVINTLNYELLKERAEKLLHFVEYLDVLVNDSELEIYPTKPKDVCCPDLTQTILFLDDVSNVYDYYDDLTELVEPDEVDFVPNLDSLLPIITDIENLIIDYDELLSVNEPSEVLFDESVGSIVSVLDSVVSIGTTLNEFISCINDEPIVVNEPNNVSLTIDSILDSISYVIINCNRLQTDIEPSQPFNDKRVRGINNFLKVIESFKLNDLESTLESLDFCNNEIEGLEKELDSIRKELGVCPVCGKPW